MGIFGKMPIKLSNEMDIEMTDTESRLGLLGEMIDLKSLIKKK